jgi:hypothetical protein
MHTLRKCVVSKYVFHPYAPVTETTPAQDASRSWEEVGEALFHGFGSDYEESSEGFGNFSTAIVEWPDGKIEMVRADKIRFLHPMFVGVDLPAENGDHGVRVVGKMVDGRFVILEEQSIRNEST